MPLRTLDCGCKMGKEGDVFLVYPCSPTCPNYQYVIKKSREEGKPVEIINTGVGLSYQG